MLVASDSERSDDGIRPPGRCRTGSRRIGSLTVYLSLTAPFIDSVHSLYDSRTPLERSSFPSSFLLLPSVLSIVQSTPGQNGTTRAVRSGSL